MKQIFLLLSLAISSLLYGQQDSIILDDIIITDVRLGRTDQSVITIPDSVITILPSTLSEILSLHTPIYFKENGYGMVSSPRFRGTTASQTAVQWNGININSKFLGQSDFNTITTGNFNEIQIKPGGGSLTHGSGAIGGTVHLNNRLRYGLGSRSEIMLNKGSFGALKGRLFSEYSTKNKSIQIGIIRFQSDNDFEIKKINYQIRNGQFWNHGLNINAGFILNAHNSISIFTEGQQDETHFSLITPNASKTKYQNNNIRTLIKYDNQWRDLHSTIRMSYLLNQWKYFENIEGDNTSGGDMHSYILKYDGKWTINSESELIFMGEYNYNTATGFKTGIEQEDQHLGGLALLYKHHFKTIDVETGLRKNINYDYSSPLLYWINTKIKIKDWYDVGVQVSKNFRAPTFNDLYWQPGGNKNLVAENANQIELNNEFHFLNTSIGMNAYYYRINDMISWRPTFTGIWRPVNVDRAETKGIEFFVSTQQNIGNHRFTYRGTYAYTNSKNLTTQKAFVYVPKHHWNQVIGYQFTQYFVNIYTRHVGKVYTLNDNSKSLDGYMIFNAQAGYNDNNYNVVLDVKNLFDTIYESVENRPMPQRNFSITLNIKL